MDREVQFLLNNVPEDIGALGIERKLYALHAILQGDASIEHFTALADDWKIEEKAVAALYEWGLAEVPLSYPCLLYTSHSILWA